MEDRAPVSNSSANADTTATRVPQHEGRNVWVLTAYGISGLALLGVLAYYISDYVAH
jgi:hypothetical protein